jgi:hypothetical protein
VADLTPYDTGARLEPAVWTTDGGVRNAAYGKVDFDNDEGATIVTVWVESTDTGYRLVVDDHLGALEVDVS